MTRLQQLPVSLQRSLEQRSALKVIAGLMNFDAASVERVARAAGRGGADLILSLIHISEPTRPY